MQSKMNTSLKMNTTARVAALLPALGLLCCAALSSTSANAQMYKWKDAQGVTHFTDTPPPASATPAKTGVQAGQYGGESSTAGFPYELAQATRNAPVVLYTSGSCSACDQGRAFLVSRGIPFTEKTISNASDKAAYQAVGGKEQVPMLVVNGKHLVPFDSAAWNSALDGAAYPAKNMLPANYRRPAPVAAGPAQPARSSTRGPEKSEAERNATEAADILRKKQQSDGIQF
jgi:glutaredoxin